MTDSYLANSQLNYFR